MTGLSAIDETKLAELAQRCEVPTNLRPVAVSLRIVHRALMLSVLATDRESRRTRSAYEFETAIAPHELPALLDTLDIFIPRRDFAEELREC